MQKTFLTRINTEKISEEEANEEYFNLIPPGINVLKNAKGNCRNKRNKILEVLENLKSVFEDGYLHYNDVPSESKESILWKTELKKQRSNVAANKEKMVDPKQFRQYFERLSPNAMCKNLSETIDSEENKA